MPFVSAPLQLHSVTPGLAGATINAVGESAAAIGRVRLQNGPSSGPKTLSSAGGAIAVRLGSATWASGSTTVRLGIQGVGADGLEDNAWGVYADLVPGTETLSAAWNLMSMESGSVSLNDDDLIAIVTEMTARGGADSISVSLASATLGNSMFPYGTTDAGVLSKTSNSPYVVLKCNDGTYAWLHFALPLIGGAAASSSLVYNSGSSPDEYGAQFALPFRARLVGVGFAMNALTVGTTLEGVLYSDPGGTPVVVSTITTDTDLNSSGGIKYRSFSSAPTLEANTDYALTIRPTDANNVTIPYLDFGSGFDFLKYPLYAMQAFSYLKMVGRTDQSGAFAETQAYHLPRIVLFLEVDNGMSPVGRATVIQAATQY